MKKICFIGAGRAGRALATLFEAKSIGEISVWNRSIISKEQMRSKKRWLSFFSQPSGKIII